MKFKVRCFSFLRRLKGHNNDESFVYEFEAELVFRSPTEGISGTFSIHSENPKAFTVGKYYELEVKEPTQDGAMEPGR